MKIIKIIPILLCFVCVFFFESNNQIKASSLSNHPYSGCYKKISLYSGWKYDSNGNININYTYSQKGSLYYGYRFGLADTEWSEHFSFFKINKVSSNPNLTVISADYGDTGWVGKAYYIEYPKRILINEWQHKNLDWYDYTAYERVSIHELGHTHGLDHTSCVNEIMSNNSDRDIYQTWLGNGDVSGIRDIY